MTDLSFQGIVDRLATDATISNIVLLLIVAGLWWRNYKVDQRLDSSRNQHIEDVKEIAIEATKAIDAQANANATLASKIDQLLEVRNAIASGN